MSAAVGTTAHPVGLGRLSLVELRRYLARAGVHWLLVAMVAIVAMTGFVAYRSSQPPSESQVERAQQIYAQQLAEWERNGDEWLADCQAQQEAARATDPSVDFGCDAELMTPKLEQFLPYRATFAEAAQGWLEQTSTFLLLLAVIVGATFVAAEFSTGSIGTWLTFEPRRGRVFASKVGTVALATGVAVLVAAALAVGAFWAACAVHDGLGDVTGALWTQLAYAVLRAGALGVGTAALGAALAFLLRHTAAVVAVVFAWLVVLENLLRAGYPSIERWTLQLSLTAWLQGGTTYSSTQDCTTDPSGGMSCQYVPQTLSMAHGGLVLLAVVAVVTAAALLVFRRRDVA
jgi:ABC-2 type transport system permease protein